MTAAERGEATDDQIPAELLTGIRKAPAPDSLAPYGRLFWGSRGRLWVQRTRPAPLGGSFLGFLGSTYDVFDPEGQFLGTLTAPPGAILQSAAGDTVFGFETGELDETSVVAYQLRFD